MKDAIEKPVGKHLLLDLFDCGVSLSDQKFVEKVMTSAAINSGAHIVDFHFHKFAPQGISGVVIIKESHLSIHTWPEHNFASIDIYTCGDLIDFKKAEKTLIDAFSAKSTKRKYIKRG